jgi:hypothetical protein
MEKVLFLWLILYIGLIGYMYLNSSLIAFVLDSLNITPIDAAAYTA